VAGIDWNLTYDHLKRAALNIRAGAAFIGTNGDRTFPSSEGIIPGAGAILAAIAIVTRRRLAFGGLLSKFRHYTHTWIHETLVDLLAIQKEIHPGPVVTTYEFKPDAGDDKFILQESGFKVEEEEKGKRISFERKTPAQETQRVPVKP
jgi:hypothetical protein